MRNRAIVFLLIVAAAAGGYLAMRVDAATTAEVSIYREETLVTTYYPGPGEETTAIKSWVKGPKMRTDAAEGADVTIVRPDLNLVYVINTKRRVYSESPLAVYQQAGRLTMTMLATDPAFQWTGRKKKIAAWSCREVVMAEETGANGDRIKTIWWVTKDPVLTVRLLRHLMTISFGDAIDELATRFYDKLDNVGGFPVQTETEATHGDKSLRRVQTLRKLERREIPDSTFELPPNLTKITVPLPPGFGG